MSDWVTPVPIPNTEVKPISADDSSNAKVGRCLDNILSFFVANFYIKGLTRSFYCAILLRYLGNFSLRNFVMQRKVLSLCNLQRLRWNPVLVENCWRTTMSVNSNNLIAFPSAANPSSNVEPTDDELAPYAKAFLEEKRRLKPDTKLTEEVILASTVIRTGLVKRLYEDVERKKKEEEDALAAELAAAEAEFLLPSPVVQPKLTQPVLVEKPVIPHEVDLCHARMIGLLPSCVFEMVETSAAVRFFLIKSIKTAQELLKQCQPGSHPLYQLRLQEYARQVQALIDLINDVIVAWGENPRTYLAGHDMITHVRMLLEEDPQFWYLWNPPSMKKIEEEERQQAEEVQKRERRKVLEPVICDLLAQAGGDPGSIVKMAERLVRKFDDLEDPQLVLKAAAVDKMIETKNSNDPTLKLYAQAAKLSDEDLAKAVAEKKAAAPLVKPKSSKKTQQEKQAARNAADDKARPKPNVGSGDPRHWKK